MNFVEAVDALKVGAEKLRADAHKTRLKARDLYQHITESLEGSGLKRTGGDHETDETVEMSLLVPNTYPQEYIRVIAHDVGSVILQRRDQTGRTIRPTESGDTTDVMKALAKLARD